jgi:hypothetical protein
VSQFVQTPLASSIASRMTSEYENYDSQEEDKDEWTAQIIFEEVESEGEKHTPRKSNSLTKTKKEESHEAMVGQAIAKHKSNV